MLAAVGVKLRNSAGAFWSASPTFMSSGDFLATPTPPHPFVYLELLM